MGCRNFAQSPNLSFHSCGEGRPHSRVIYLTSGRRRPPWEDEHLRGAAVMCCYGITRLAGLTPRRRMWCREGVGRTWNHKALLVGPWRRRSLQIFPVSRLLRLRSAGPACWLWGGSRRDPWHLRISLVDSSMWGEGQPHGAGEEKVRYLGGQCLPSHSCLGNKGSWLTPCWPRAPGSALPAVICRLWRNG